MTSELGIDTNGMPVFMNNLRSYDDVEQMKQVEEHEMHDNQPKGKSPPTIRKSKLINRKSTIPLSPVRSNNLSPEPNWKEKHKI